MKTLVITSGGFDPLHAGHISAFEKMAKVGDLYVIVNNDVWLQRKKEKELLGWNNRCTIIQGLKSVKTVWLQHGNDDHVIGTLEHLIKLTKQGHTYDRFVFAKSGDRTHENSPEYEWCMANGVEWLEVESDYPELHSSGILADWQNTPIKRSWGEYLTTVPYQVGDLKFKPKVLVVKPGQSLSLQSHKHRKEVWYVIDGSGLSIVEGLEIRQHSDDVIIVEANSKHQIINDRDKPFVILEWQIGSEVSEEDITRYPS